MSNYKDEIRTMLAKMDNQESQDNTQLPPEDIQDVYVFIVREHEVAEDQMQVVDSTPLATSDIEPPPAPATVSTQPDSFLSAYLFVGCSLLVILATLTFQLYSLFNPPIATVTIIPKSQQVILKGTLQLGRILQPITISQSQTTTTTGHGHQDAKAATGSITFYNGQLSSIFVPAGTILTGSDGVAVITDQDASIPAANLPQVGHATVSAHAVNPGANGNIAAYDINQGCCATAIKAVNTNAFAGGQDERTYTTVTQHDIHKLSTVLKTSLAQSITGALQGQRQPGEQLSWLPCTPTVKSDHQIGEEATQVTVTVSQTCSAVAYHSQTITDQVTTLLTTQAKIRLGTGYSLQGVVHVTVKQATVMNSIPTLFFSGQGTWVFALSTKTQQHIKQLLAGKSLEEAKAILAHEEDIQQSGIRLTGLTDRVPKNPDLIHLVFLYKTA